MLSDTDDYMVAPCNKENEIIISLSEEAVIEAIQIQNREEFSSTVKKFRLYSSDAYPTNIWKYLGEFELKEENKELNTFYIDNSWGRYVKFEWVESFDTHAYCILSQIKVCGHSVI